MGAVVTQIGTSFLNFSLYLCILLECLAIKEISIYNMSLYLLSQWHFIVIQKNYQEYKLSIQCVS